MLYQIQFKDEKKEVIKCIQVENVSTDRISKEIEKAKEEFKNKKDIIGMVCNENSSDFLVTVNKK